MISNKRASRKVPYNDTGKGTVIVVEDAFNYPKSQDACSSLHRSWPHQHGIEENEKGRQGSTYPKRKENHNPTARAHYILARAIKNLVTVIIVQSIRYQKGN
jgi:hypothetical protein